MVMLGKRPRCFSGRVGLGPNFRSCGSEPQLAVARAEPASTAMRIRFIGLLPRAEWKSRAHRWRSAPEDRGSITGRGAHRSGRSRWWRSEEHTSELQSLMRISYAVFCLKKKKRKI